MDNSNSYNLNNYMDLNNKLFSYEYIPFNIKDYNSNSNSNNNNVDKIIIFLNSNNIYNNNNNQQLNVLNSLLIYLNKIKILNISIVNNSDQLNQLNITNNSIIYFLPTLNKLDLNNFKSILLQYCDINKYLINNKITSKLIVFSTLTKIECNYYLNSSILGAMRYFLDFKYLELYFIDFDYKSLNDINIQLINSVIFNNNNSSSYIQREFIFRNNELLIEIIKNNPTLLNSKPISPDKYSLYKSFDICGKTILVTGQTGTILNIINWLINNRSNYINNIIILTVSEMKSDLKKLIEEHYNNENNIKFYFQKVDISNYEMLDLAINQLYSDNIELPKPDTIIHFAFVKALYNYNEISIENIDKSLSVKAMGSIYLHLLSIKYNWPIKNYINGSSTCSLLGLKDECGYVSASLILDSLMRYRTSISGGNISINWGSISRDLNISKAFQNQGLSEVSNDLIFYIFDQILFNNQDNNNNINNFVVSNFNFNHFKKNIINSNYNYLFNNILD